MSLRLVATSRKGPQNCGPAGCGDYPQHAEGPGMSRGTSAYGADMSYPPDMRGGASLGYKEPAGGNPGWGRPSGVDLQGWDRTTGLDKDYPGFGRGGVAAPMFSNSSTPPMNGDMAPLARDMREMRMRLDQMEQRMQYGSGASMPQPMGFATPLSNAKSKASEMVSEAEEVLSSPPPTWGPYLQKKDYQGLVKMEAREMLSAVENNKSPEDIKKEVKHVLAAVLKLVGD